MEKENVDPEELKKFAALAAIWWDRGGAFKALHDINPLRVGWIDSRAGLAGRSVVDVGCGGGLLAEAMAARGARVTGIDAGEAALGAARAHLKISGLAVDYRRSTAEAFAREHPRGYDIVTCLELLEHVPQPASVVAACARLVKPGGDLFFATLNRNPKSFLFAIVGAELLLGLVARGTHRYRRFVKPAELGRWGRENGLAPSALTGLHYHPLGRRYSLGGNTHVNYLMHLKAPARPA
jgi:2-polyprenyl-6-hydroxyphenyl methylase/3-demethylubiquinone-9 3-methyltransferase